MITVTKTAQTYLQQNMAEAPNGSLGIRIGLRDAGCSGFAYTIDFTDAKQADDQLFHFDGLNILIDKKFMQALDGMELDYVTQGVNSILQFNNPNVVNACGCGESVQFKEDKDNS